MDQKAVGEKDARARESVRRLKNLMLLRSEGHPAGDPNQIDHPFPDERTNGLSSA
ncbi:hypothetical protein [Blautia parvula]|uniref:Uncharacterized protein n=1 Tax=Blautia parvula TaxID=2877527 RepID=A0ABQ0C3C4_9FIRM